MAGPRRPDRASSRPADEPTRDETIRAFVAGLEESERMLIVLRDGLYDGDWEAMLADLQARLADRPYIFKLVNRIQDDMAHIQKLAALERARAINLADYLEEGEMP